MKYEKDIEKLRSLYYDYRESYERLYEEFKSSRTKQEYCRGGEVLHRGYYCPSPVLDIVIGRGNRGRLVKHPRKNTLYDYIYYKNEDGRLLMAEKYDTFLPMASVNTPPCSREFVISSGRKEIAPIYKLNPIVGQINIASLSLCEFDEGGRLLSYSFLHMPTYLDSNNQLKTMEDCMQFYAEHFRYDSDGLLEESSLKDTFDKFTRISRFKFFHDPQGFLSSYLSGDEQGNYSPNIYQIPACKRRRL